MKIQELAIIFIIIILPISMILSVYTQFEIRTLNTQTLYDTKLTSATFDAIKAFQLNTANSTMSNLSNSKLRDLEASISTFKTSIASAFGLSGISEEEMEEYIPALVYTMYDGFYVYAPFTNTNYLYDSTGHPLNNNEKVIYGLQPYVTYSCNYQSAGKYDVVITYSLDNYITIKGMVDGDYITDEGYLIGGIEIDDATGIIKYNGVEIDKESNLKEYVVDGKTGIGYEYEYRKVNGTKYYYDNNQTPENAHDDRIFYLSNGEKVTQGRLEGELAFQYYNTVIKNNTSAIQYYREAKEFTDRVESYGLLNMTYKNAYDKTTGNPIWPGDGRKVLSQNGSNIDTNIEYELSNFTQHKLAVIRYVIEKNLSEVIANYNNYSSALGIDFQMPKLTEDEWDNVIKNISLISFVQGIPIGGKIYNGYTIVNNTESKEVVKEEDIYVIGKDNYYHKIGDVYIDGDAGQENIGSETESIPAGRLKLDFKKTTVIDANNDTIYYYPREEFASYDSVVTQNNMKTYEDIYKYVVDASNSLKDTFYSALGRERKSSYKSMNTSTYVYDVLLVGKTADENKIKAIVNYINENKENSDNTVMKARYKCGNSTELATYLDAQKENYSLIIMCAFEGNAKDLVSPTFDLNNMSTYTNIMTIGWKNNLNKFSTGTSTIAPGANPITTKVTTFGKTRIGLQIQDRTVTECAVSNFNEEVKVLYTSKYGTNEYDSIGYLENGNYAWMNSQISLGENEIDYPVISKLARLTLEGLPEGIIRVLLAGHSTTDESDYIKSIEDELNNNDIINANSIFNTNRDYMISAVKERASDYDVIILHWFDQEIPTEIIRYIRDDVLKKPNIVSITSKSKNNLDIIQSSTAINRNVTPKKTKIGEHYIGENINISDTRIYQRPYFVEGGDSLKILCKDSATGEDLIAYWEAFGIRWVHSAINIEQGSYDTNTSGEKVITKLALMAINGQDEYTVTFNPNGGSVNPEKITVYYGETITLPLPTRSDGSFFGGWFDEYDNSGPCWDGADYEVEKNVTLIAKWIAEPEYTITYDPNGGMVDSASAIGKNGAKITLPTPTFEGFTFKGWKDSAGTKYGAGAQYTINGDAVLTATWQGTFIKEWNVDTENKFTDSIELRAGPNNYVEINSYKIDWSKFKDKNASGYFYFKVNNGSSEILRTRVFIDRYDGIFLDWSDTYIDTDYEYKASGKQKIAGNLGLIKTTQDDGWLTTIDKFPLKIELKYTVYYE